MTLAHVPARAQAALDTALDALELGFSPLPPVEDGTKRPLADIPDGQVDGKQQWTWKPYQTKPATRQKVRKWFKGDRQSIGLVTGYNGLECFEFDCPETFERFLAAALEVGLGDLVMKIRAGYEERTPGEGYHWLYYCDEVRGNQKLAERPDPTDPQKRIVLIETRGEGGFVIIAPSKGKVHPSGKAYELLSGGLDRIVTLASEERESLWDLARSFDELPLVEGTGPPKPRTTGRNPPDTDVRPGDDYEARTTWEDILEPLGWVPIFTRGDTTYWRRPDKDRGVSATTGHCKGLYVFSTSTSFAARTSYSKFGAYAHLNHGGDHQAAAKALAEAGYGSQPKRPPAGDRRHQADGKGNGKLHSNGSGGHIDFASMTDEDLGIVGADKIAIRPVKWLWEYRLAAGEMSLFAGEGGLGKSQMLLAVAAAVSTGSDWPDRGGKAPLGRAVLLSAEDSPETTIVPRLIALGAGLGRITILKAKVTIKRRGEDHVIHPVSLSDRDYWRVVFDRLKDTLLFVVDPLPSYLGKGVDDQRNNEVREIIEPFLDEVTRPRGIHMAANTHLNKSVDARIPLHRVIGSVAYSNLPRNVHFVVRDPDDPERRFFKQAKCNNAPENLPAIAFKVEKRMIPSTAGEIETAIPVFEEATVDVDLGRLMNGDKGRQYQAPQTEKLAKFLLAFLRGKGPVFVADIADEAGRAGFIGKPCMRDGKPGWSNFNSLYRAIEAVPELPPPDGGWRILTPQDDPELRSVKGHSRWQAKRSDAPF